jgi:hypothetical protein
MCSKIQAYFQRPGLHEVMARSLAIAAYIRNEQAFLVLRRYLRHDDE